MCPSENYIWLKKYFVFRYVFIFIKWYAKQEIKSIDAKLHKNG